jgi:flagellar assembly factor FliW
MSSALRFIESPPGLSPLTEFDLLPVDGASGLYSLVATRNQNLRLYAVDAGVYLPEYRPVISDDHATALGLITPDDALVLVVATPSGTGTTVNLMAPIVVNSSTGASAQVILDGQDWPLRHTLGTAQAA